ncbi:hypothetical protein AB0F72_09020 [Actinoplanes sp. NPDC023936]|uniref:hypothetical protein n=1 Tax=Actinoplanes sp. NPDC023936 TaxID=3154910 RepID=UPI0034053859
MRDRYGQPEKLTRAEVARILRTQNRRDEVHPYNCAGFRYPTLEGAYAFADLNRANHGHFVYGPYETTGGIVNIVDFRPSLHADHPDWEATDPALPDDWTPEVNRG